ncbi:MAG: P-loop NTPase [Pyrobaculum sp.]
MDPRALYILKKFSEVRGVLAFASAKGGVGKSTLATLFSLALGRRYDVCLVDLDVTNPNLHLILGVDLERVEIVEDRGVKPLDVGEIKFFTPAIFTRGETLPLKGQYVVETIREVFTMLNLSGIDIVVLDMPPGVKEEFFEISRWPVVKTVVVATQELLGSQGALRLIKLLKEEGVRHVALVENMATRPPMLNMGEVTHLGTLPYDPSFVIGNMEALRSTQLYRSVEAMRERLLEFLWK